MGDDTVTVLYCIARRSGLLIILERQGVACVNEARQGIPANANSSHRSVLHRVSRVYI